MATQSSSLRGLGDSVAWIARAANWLPTVESASSSV